MSESLLQKLFQKEPFIPANHGPSNADKFPPFPDGTIFINIKKEKSLWLIVDNGKLRSFDGDLSSDKLGATKKLNKLSSTGEGERWMKCKDIEVIFPSVDKVRITEV
ncbi:hypothetical protein AB6D90_23865 [Vibrio splendidus]|uniref:hypothetical protein n=1 Tax=Vibrio splendidus TaxID=29497 RepID=UPI000D3D6E22|nr:hypothetical protein [Vibrio splendidus]PTO76039.1 hypothetical protein CWN84_13805 [Vibrio splendidus]